MTPTQPEVKLVGILLANIAESEKFDPLRSEIWFGADGAWYRLIVGSEQRVRIAEAEWVNLAGKIRVHVKVTGTPEYVADNIAQFRAVDIERIDL
jgi:hypothetical protein